MQVTTVGFDLAKIIFQVHGVTETGEVAFNRPLRRARVLAFFQRLSPCVVGIEACASSLAAEFEITIARGVARAIEFAKSIIDGKQPELPDLAQDVLRVLSRQLMDLHNRLDWFETMLGIEARLSRQAQLLQTIPGVVPVTASAVAATIGSGRQTVQEWPRVCCVVRSC